jgi:CRISPR-associated protein Cas1
MLRRNHEAPDPTLLNELEILAKKVEVVTEADSLLGLEGAAARAYFQAFSGMLRPPTELEPFDLERRNRRPPSDPTNALLSFMYSLLAKDETLACQAAGLEPLLGFLHRPRFGRPALALDLMEEMRPIVADSVVLQVINMGVVTNDDFLWVADSVALRPHARKKCSWPTSAGSTSW